MLECRQTVQQMRDGVPLMYNCDDFTSRGLEYCTPEGFDITSSSGELVRLILEEQQRQKGEGIVDPDMLAAAAGGISRHRSRIAHLAAMKDARVVYGEERLLTSSSISSSSSFSSASGMNDNDGSPTVTNKRESRRCRKNRSGSSGSFVAMEEQVRRRRGSRGPLGERLRDRQKCTVGS
jgi:hypothetical protein